MPMKCVCLKNVLFWNLWKFCFIKKSPIFNFYIIYNTITPNADVFSFVLFFSPHFICEIAQKCFPFVLIIEVTSIKVSGAGVFRQLLTD